MTSRDVQRSAESSYLPKEYWRQVAETYDAADRGALAPVLHPGAPGWFNELVDKLQFRAIRRALEIANLSAGARVLDVGCGTGRWLRRYVELGLNPIGVDRTCAMLSIARTHGTRSLLAAGEAHRLPFADSHFDCVTDVTVVQHIPSALQAVALGEMTRVLAPGGRLILMELIRGEGAHIFPQSPESWIEQVRANGAKLVAWFGQEYLLLDRVFVRLAQKAAGRESNHSHVGKAQSASSAQSIGARSRRAYWAMRRVTAPLSALSDAVIEKLVPSRVATHGVFVFQK